MNKNCDIVLNIISKYTHDFYVENNKKDILKDISFLKREKRIFFRNNSIIFITNPIFIENHYFGRYKLIINRELYFIKGVLAKNIDNDYLHPIISNKYSHYSKKWNTKKYNYCCLNNIWYDLLNKGLLINFLDIAETSLSNIDVKNNYFGIGNPDKIFDVCINPNKYALCYSCEVVFEKKFRSKICRHCI